MKTKIPSPSRSQGAHTPRRKPRRTLSVGSPALSTASGRLTSVVQVFVNKHMNSFALSPVPKRRSVLTDNTDIMEEPNRKSWWNKLNDNSRNVLEVLEDNNIAEPNNIMEELDIEILSQEKKNYSMDIPESSDGESINSIVIPQKKLFPRKESQHQNVFGQIIGTRETMTKSNKNMTINDNVVNAGTKQLFQNKPRSKPLFPAAFLDITPDKTVMDKTKESAAEPKTQARNLFGNHQGAKRKNMFADFIVSESEDEIPEIQPRIFGFTKKPVLIRQESSASRVYRESSPTSNITTDTEMDEWRLLPSSTMVEHQLEAMMEPNTPKRPRLSKLTETKESSEANTVFSKTKSPEVNTSVLTRSRLRELNNSTISTSNEKNKSQEKSNQNRSKNNQSQNDKSRDKIKESNKKIEQNEDENLGIANISQGKMNQSKGKRNKSLQKTNVSQTIIDGIENDHSKFNTSKNINKNQSNVNETKNKSQNQLKEKIVSQSQEIVESEETDDQNPEVVDRNQTANIVLEANQSQEQIDEELEQQNEVNVSQENSKHKNITESLEVEESEEVNESKKIEDNREVEEDENQEGEIENEEIESQEVAEESDKEEEEGQDKINESQVQDDENEEQANGSYKHYDDNIEQEGDKGQTVDQSLAEVKESDDAIDQSQIDEYDEEIDQTANKVNESSDAADESNENADQSQEEIDGSNHVADESNQVVDESNEAVNQTQEEVDESNQAADESNEAINQTQEEFDESNQAADESNDAVNQTEEEVDESNDVQNQSQSTIEDDENEASDHDEDNQEEVDESDEEQNESQEDDENEAENAELHYESASEEMELDIEPQNDQVDTPVDQENNINTPEPARNECNITHDTTGRHKHTPEAVLHDKSKRLHSFTARPNTSIRKTKSIGFTARDSVGFSDGTTNSSAEGSGWDSHRTTRKTIRQTFGKDATMRKSLRALVMEKSAKRQTLASETAKAPLANSTELPEISLGYLDTQPLETHEVSLRTRQMTLDAVLEKIKEDNLKKKAEIEEAVKKSLAQSDTHIFKVPLRPMFPRRQANPQNKASKVKAKWHGLPEEMIEDLQYKPPKRFKPSNAPWITKRLYKYLENKLEPKYDYKARVRAEKLVETLYNYTKDLRRQTVASEDSTKVLKHEMARLQIVRTHHEFYEFFRQFMPKEIRIKVIPDVVNKIPLPRRDVFSDILTDSAQG